MIEKDIARAMLRVSWIDHSLVIGRLVTISSSLHPCSRAEGFFPPVTCVSLTWKFPSEWTQIFFISICSWFAISAFWDGRGEQLVRIYFSPEQIDPVLRTFWACNTGLDGFQIQLEHFGKFDLPFLRDAEHLLACKYSLIC